MQVQFEIVAMKNGWKLRLFHGQNHSVQVMQVSIFKTPDAATDFAFENGWTMKS